MGMLWPQITDWSPKDFQHAEEKPSLPLHNFSLGKGLNKDTHTHGRRGMSEKHKRKRVNLWIEGLEKWIPNKLMYRQPTKVLEVLVPTWKGLVQHQLVG